MGIAAYNRGSMAISNAIDQSQPSSVFRLLEALTLAGEGGVRVFADTVVRIDETGSAWLMNRKDKGWGEYGRCYRSPWQIAREYKLFWSGIGRDSTSFYYEVKAI